MQEMIRGKCYPFTVKPNQRGDYCYVGDGWASAAPCYASFDGENWESLAGSTTEFWFYTDTPEPYHHQHPYEPPPPPSLADRLEQYKKSKVR